MIGGQAEKENMKPHQAPVPRLSPVMSLSVRLGDPQKLKSKALRTYILINLITFYYILLNFITFYRAAVVYPSLFKSLDFSGVPSLATAPGTRATPRRFPVP